MRPRPMSEGIDADSEPEPAAELALLNPNRYPEVRAARLEQWLRPVLAELAPGASSFAVRFVGDRAMRRINRDYRGADRATDVLSFPGDDGPEGRHLGDVAISVPTARRQAEEGGRPIERELRTLILHGLLHCLGYDHESDDGEMERLERRLRARLLEKA